VKIAFVVGFFEPVKKPLFSRYPEDVYHNRLIWVESGKRAITIFKEQFYDVVKTAHGLLVCLGRSGNQRHIENAVKGIIGVATAQYETPIRLNVFANLYDATPVIQTVEGFGLDNEIKIGADDVRAKIGNGKILCVSPQGKTSITDALERASFSKEAIDECFVEEIQEYGRNSNLMQHLKSSSASYVCLLYAWEGLRTSDQDVKDSYAYGCYEAPTASQVVDFFKAWIVT
jgi:hypothetical protein